MLIPTPALSSLLERYFNPESVKTLSEVFKLATSLNQNFEGRVKREEAASFNPLPCRVASILINEGKTRDAAVISAAFFVSANIDYFLRNTDFSIASLIEIAKAIVIDDLRHLHMTDYSKEELRQRISWLEEQILPKLNNPTSLDPYLKTALLNAKRRCTV